jgi:glycosyltransferase involved in cell wall biosynthesis
VSSPIRLVHHGSAERRRGLDAMIEAMALLRGDYRLDFALVGQERDRERLRMAAVADERISFVSPVPMPQLPSFLNSYDVGVYLLRPDSFNQLHALPNKLFEFVQARLAVVIAPSPDMAEVVRRHEVGVVADDFSPEAFARALAGLDAERLASLKSNADRAAARLNADTGRAEVLRLVDRALA